MQIHLAAEEHLAEINRLIARSKSHWDWSPEYLSAALPLMALTVTYLGENICFELCDDEMLVGFVSVAETADGRVLDNLWIEPARIGQGLGRAACKHVFDLARQEVWPELTTLPDPPSEGFYLRMGFRDTGERVQSRVFGGPTFSVFRKEFGPA
jgi:GNAT superfamily N-acetyltransferase